MIHIHLRSFRGPWGPWGVLGGPWGAWGVLGSRRLLKILIISFVLHVKVRSKDKCSYGLLSNIDYFSGFMCKSGRMGQKTLGIIDNKGRPSYIVKTSIDEMVRTVISSVSALECTSGGVKIDVISLVLEGVGNNTLEITVRNRCVPKH